MDLILIPIIPENKQGDPCEFQMTVNIPVYKRKHPYKRYRVFYYLSRPIINLLFCFTEMLLLGYTRPSSSLLALLPSKDNTENVPGKQGIAFRLLYTNIITKGKCYTKAIWQGLIWRPLFLFAHVDWQRGPAISRARHCKY